MSTQPVTREAACSGTLPGITVLSGWVVYLGGIATFLYMIARSLLYDREPSVAILGALTLAGWLWACWSIGSRAVQRAEATEDGLKIRFAGLNEEQLGWQEVTSAKWRKSYGWGNAVQLLILQGQSPKSTVRLSNRLSHFEELVAYMGAHLPPTVELPPRPPL